MISFRKIWLAAIVLLVSTQPASSGPTMQPESDYYPRLKHIWADDDAVWFFSDSMYSQPARNPTCLIKLDHRWDAVPEFHFAEDLYLDESIPVPPPNSARTVSLDEQIIIDGKTSFRVQQNSSNLGKIQINRNGSWVPVPELTRDEFLHYARYSFANHNVVDDPDSSRILWEWVSNRLTKPFILYRNRIYCGLGAGASEGIRGIGGLAVYDIAGNELTIKRDPMLADAGVLRFFPLGDTLVFSTASFGEYYIGIPVWMHDGIATDVNLVAYDIEKDSFRHLDPYGKFAGTLILNVLPHEDRLYLITTKGIGCLPWGKDAYYGYERRWDFALSLNEVRNDGSSYQRLQE